MRHESAGTITLGSALPNITASVSLNGPGASQLTISGNNSFRVFTLTVSSPGAVNFSALTIANGRISNDVGGGIYTQNSGNVNVTDCVINNNFANTIANIVVKADDGQGTIYTLTVSSDGASDGSG